MEVVLIKFSLNKQFHNIKFKKSMLTASGLKQKAMSIFNLPAHSIISFGFTNDKGEKQLIDTEEDVILLKKDPAMVI